MIVCGNGNENGRGVRRNGAVAFVACVAPRLSECRALFTCAHCGAPTTPCCVLSGVHLRMRNTSAHRQGMAFSVSHVRVCVWQPSAQGQWARHQKNRLDRDQLALVPTCPSNQLSLSPLVPHNDGVYVCVRMCDFLILGVGVAVCRLVLRCNPMQCRPFPLVPNNCCGCPRLSGQGLPPKSDQGCTLTGMGWGNAVLLHLRTRRRMRRQSTNTAGPIAHGGWPVTDGGGYLRATDASVAIRLLVCGCATAGHIGQASVWDL